MKIIQALLISVLVLIGCGHQDMGTQRIRLVELYSRENGVPVLRYFDTALNFYCQPSYEAGIANLKKPKCVPYSGSVFYSDNRCTVPFIASITDPVNITPRYVTDDGKFFRLGEEINSPPNMILFERDQNQNCLRVNMTDLSGFRIVAPVNIEEFGDI